MPVTLRLPHRLGIVLPSRDRQGGLLSGSIRRSIRRKVEAWFASAFSGSTEDRMQVRPRLRGRWDSGSKVTTERIEEIWAYCTAAEFAALAPSLIRLAEAVCREGNQQAVALLLDSGMQIVTEEGES